MKSSETNSSGWAKTLLLSSIVLIFLGGGNATAQPPAEALAVIQAKFPDATVIANYQEELPLIGNLLFHFKLHFQDRDTTTAVCLNKDLVEFDCEAPAVAETDARFQAYGLMDDALADWVSKADDSASEVIGLFVRVNEENLPVLDRRLLSTTSSEQAERIIEEHQVSMSTALQDAKRPFLDELAAGGKELVYSSPLSPLVFARLTRADVMRLAWESDCFTGLTRETRLNRLASIIGTESAGLNTFYQHSINGSGYKVAVIEPGETYFDNPYITSPTVRRVNKTHNSWANCAEPGHPVDHCELELERHATFVGGITSSTYWFWPIGANQAQVISANWAGNEFPESEVCAAMDWAIASPRTAKIINNSWGCPEAEQWDCGTSVAYHMDYLSNHYWTTFTKASGNEGEYNYESTCESYSQICVGAYDDENTTPYRDPPFGLPAWHVFDDQWVSFSSYKNPSWSGDRELPSVTAPGYGITATREDDSVYFDWFCTQNELNNRSPSFCNRGYPAPAAEPVSSGTSFSTPVVSALSAMLMDQDASLSYFPEAVRAVILASATNDTDCTILGYWPTECPTSIMRKSDRDGYGGINGEDAYNLMTTGHVHKPYISKVPDNSVAYTITYYVPSGQTIRAALSWLEDVQWIRNNSNNLKNDFDLKLYNPSNQMVAYSGSWKDNNEVIEYNTTVSGNYTFKIWNYRWRNPADFVFTGLAITWFSSTYADHPR